MTVRDFMEVYDDAWVAIVREDEEVILTTYMKDWNSPHYSDILERKVNCICAYPVGDTYPISPIKETFKVDPDDTIFYVYIKD